MSLATVLIVEDDPALREALSDTLELAGYPVRVAEEGHAALEIMQRERVGMVVSDVQMRPMDGHSLLRHIKASHSGVPVLLMTAYGTIQQAVEAMHDGAVDYLVKPFEAEVLVSKVAGHLKPVNDELVEGPVAEDLRSREILELARRVARSDATVLLNGESGTGKEVYARYIHQCSQRAEGPFIAINCAAIPENMLEAMLFGYEKGAFTGAYQSAPGKFEQAQGGTLLLDEISEMSLPLQAKLLRVLQERELERLGGRKLIELDVRVLATTNRKLREEVSAGRFREDLYYRLNVFPLTLPPLRDRQRDILPLARHLLRKALRPGESLPEFSNEAKQRLLGHGWQGNIRELDNLIQRAVILRENDLIREHDLCFEEPASAETAEERRVPQAGGGRLLGHAWPGNIRELDNLIQRAVILRENDLIREHDLCFEEPSPPETAEERRLPQSGGGRLPEDLRSVEEQMILDALEEGSGSRKMAAEKLGISERTLRYKIARMREAGVAIPG